MIYQLRVVRSSCGPTYTRTSTAQRSFAVNGPRTWNSLPAALRSPDLSLLSFKRQLKTYLFPHRGCQVPEQPSGAIVTV